MSARRAQLVGIGLIGGSIGLALREAGWHVTGSDRYAASAARALELGAVDALGDDVGAELTFVATPVGTVADIARGRAGVVTDVGSVKASIVAAVDDPRFVGGHPMAGSEQEGVDGSRADLFQGAVWVLTPVASTDPAAHALVRSVVSSFGAEVVELAPERHDALVAVVSHVPHLTAVSLMRLASERSEEHAALLRLAAGGFRDMTRIAAGHPGIWPDICIENRAAISEVLEVLIGELTAMRVRVDTEDRAGLLDALTRARAARLNLPGRVAATAELTEVRVPVPDRPGVLAEITTLASELGVNIHDLEIAHSSEGAAGVLLLIVDAEHVARLVGGLATRGYKATAQDLE
jgi:prephenate dehydrogenase